jgi:hypothetical protein
MTIIDQKGEKKEICGQWLKAKQILVELSGNEDVYVLAAEYKDRSRAREVFYEISDRLSKGVELYEMPKE